MLPTSSRQRSSTGDVDAGGVGRRGERVRLVGRAERGVVARLLDGLGDDVGIERARPRVALAAVDDDAHADALDLGDRERLDLAAEHLHVDVARAQHVGLDLLTGPGVAGHAPGDAQEVDVSHRRCRPR